MRTTSLILRNNNENNKNPHPRKRKYNAIKDPLKYATSEIRKQAGHARSYAHTHTYTVSAMRHAYKILQNCKATARKAA